MDVLLYVGTKLAALMGSPAGGVFGSAVALFTGFQALKDLFAGKIRLRRDESTSYANLDTRREHLRKKIVCVRITQIILAVLNLAAIIWLYVFATITKREAVLIPDASQSVGFLVVFFVTLIAIGLELTQLWLSARHDKAK
jgi:hypothetical protein